MSETVGEAEQLLKAGAVLPVGTQGAADRAVPLTARAYRHPGVEGRTVVRLVAEELGAAEDLAAGFLGLEPAAEPAVVGLGRRQALGFPEWVLVHHPEDGHHALAVVPELERTVRQAKSKPKAALDAYQEIAGRLAAAVPHFLPTFYEQAGRTFLAVENAAYASQMFTRARRAEAEHGLAIDEERLDAVFLEFALAGALPVKVLSGYAKELSARVAAPEAFRRFRRLCVRRTAGGLQPSAQMAADLRRLAKAAGADVEAEERAYVAELLALPATLRVATGWWKAHRPALVALARREPAKRGMLLNLMPGGGEEDMPRLWLELLEESGATAGLCDGALPAEERPEDGTTGWFERFLAFRTPGWRGITRLPTLYPLVERMADRLRAELAESGRALPIVTYDVDLLDLLLSLDVPVADPDKNTGLRLEQWAQGEQQRDLCALEADPRFRPAFERGADGLSNDRDGLRAIRMLAASPGGRPMLAEWMREVARRSLDVGLPQLPDALRKLSWLPGEALVLAEDEARAAAGTDLAPLLARTLKAGLFDELSWPAWEDAAADLVQKKDVDELIVAEAWPHLIVGRPAQARVIGAEGTVLTHDLRIPAGDSWGDPGFHYVDGELHVHWNSRAHDNRLVGYWHTRADRVQPVEGTGNTRGTRMNWYRNTGPISLPLPGGGRTTGTAVLHAGDTALPEERSVITDGTSYWVWTWDGSDHESTGWYEYVPATGEVGRKGMPGFLADALRDAPAGSTFHAGWMLPAPTAEASPGGSPLNGLLGWRAVQLPDGSLRGEDLAGHTVTLPSGAGRPSRVLLFPGDDRPRAVVQGSYDVSLVDPDGVVTAVAKTDDPPGTFGEGTLILPPLRYWHCLEPRDVQGSLALRAISHDTAAGLLKAAHAQSGEELPALVRELLPEVGHDALVAGIAAVVRFAAGQQATLDAVADRIDQALAGGHHEEGPTGPSDKLLATALSGLTGSRRYWWGESPSGVFRQIRSLGQALGHTDEPATDTPAVALHLDGPELAHTELEWQPMLDRCAAVAFRAAAPTTEQEDRDALHELLREMDVLGADGVREPARWRRFTLHVDKSRLTGADGQWRAGSWCGLLPLGGGAFLACVDREGAEDSGCVFTALFHDPAGRFEVPEPYTVRASSTVGESRETGWLGAFLTEFAARGPAPWFPQAAAEFARLTGVTGTTARLVVAGMPRADAYERNFLPARARTLLGVKVAEAAVARDELRTLSHEVRLAVVAALMPAQPARLWTEGPDVAAAAEVWTRAVGRRAAVPEALLAEAVRAVRPVFWAPARALPALLDPAAEPQLSKDLAWAVKGDRVHPVDSDAEGFTASTLVGSVATTAWLAHRLPAGDPLRAALPVALTAVRDRLANPELMLDLGRYVGLPAFRKVAGPPTEVGEGYERYGAVVMATHDDQPAPGIRTALLDEAGQDPYLPALRGVDQQPFPAEVALRLARDPRFEALLADPGDPVAGERGKDGTWWPQDPTRSVPGLVTAAAKEYGIGEDAAALYLALLAMPDPSDRNTARWTGWKPARLKAARAELAGTELVVEATRTRAGRSLFLPGGWTVQRSPHLPLEQWKLSLLGLDAADAAPLGVIVPLEPAADLYRGAWQRVLDGDGPRFEELKVKGGRRR
ncbi:DNA-binding protein [Wenjunlia tyrosinilytica]|uniref:DNA-binding protein n=1 Tax=Wenjunlia tyrosinilytica TaxID=1544741 RepID=A0A918DVT0_9ACTN|nr:DNA-binding protein [Wenjunlia tyrosinilytica]GGO84347.1 DNA-binding protein [Wenjunlia tyrosinilytica]